MKLLDRQSREVDNFQQYWNYCIMEICDGQETRENFNASCLARYLIPDLCNLILEYIDFKNLSHIQERKRARYGYCSYDSQRMGLFVEWQKRFGTYYCKFGNYDENQRNGSWQFIAFPANWKNRSTLYYKKDRLIKARRFFEASLV